jgi:hypothetical protein
LTPSHNSPFLPSKKKKKKLLSPLSQITIRLLYAKEKLPKTRGVAVGCGYQTQKQNHAKDVHILSSAFLLIFLAYGGGIQNLESTVNTVSLRPVLFCITQLKFLLFYVWFGNFLRK